MRTDMRTVPFTALLIAAAMSASGCSGEIENAPNEVEQTNGTVAAVLSGRGELSILSEAMTESGLASVFDGPGAYTVLAPEDAAFDALGDRSAALMEKNQRPVLVALLRDHILPGQFDATSVRADIRRKGGPVQMRTLGDTMLSFAIEDGELTVSGERARARVIADEAVIASNGVVLPVDALLELPPGE
mgnify:CR=1 FL=1